MTSSTSDLELLKKLVAYRLCNIDHAEGEVCKNPSVDNTALDIQALGFRRIGADQIVVDKDLLASLFRVALPSIRLLAHQLAKVLHEKGFTMPE